MERTNDWVPPARDLVRERSSNEANRRIDRLTRCTLQQVGDSRTKIQARLGELDREWHLDRALMLLFSGLGSVTASQAMLSLKRRGTLGFWGLLFWTQMGFLAHHAIRGWCTPVALLRRMGFRTAREISAERVVLAKRLSDAGAA